MNHTKRSGIGHAAGRTARQGARRPGRGAMTVAALSLALALGLAGGAAAAPTGTMPPDSPGPAVGDGMPTAPLNQCAQRCFDHYIQNVGQCASLFCTQILFFTFCDNDEMTQCKQNAQGVFDLCIEGCNPLV